MVASGPYAGRMAMPRYLQSLHDAHELAGQFARDGRTHAFLTAAVQALSHAFVRGNKLLVLGNGGSLCDAAHIAEEFTGRFRKDRPPLAAIACESAGHATCVGNDYGFEEVFARWVHALARPGDVVMVLSTSGNSENVLRACAAAHKAGAMVFALTGKGGGKLAATVSSESGAQHILIAPGETADRIQELHMLALHTIVEGVEQAMGYT
jgi:D-sedoheptulose 7-phosphate isomerase